MGKKRTKKRSGFLKKPLGGEMNLNYFNKYHSFYNIIFGIFLIKLKIIS